MNECAHERRAAAPDRPYHQDMRRQFDFNDVRIFVAAAQARSMSAAGRILEVPTSSISRGLARLERYMGIQLIERGAHGIALTDAGADYLRYCVDALDVLGEGGQQLSASKNKPEGLLRVACPALMSKEIFAPLLPAFLKDHPRIQLEVLPYHPGVRGAAPTAADLVFELTAPPNPRTLVRRYPSARRGIYASETYLATVPECHVPEDLMRCDCIGSRAAPHLSQWHLVGPSGSKLVEPTFKVFAADPALLREMVRNSLGITILPVWMSLERDTGTRCVRVLPDWEPSPVPLFACVPFGSSHLPGTQALLQFLDRHLGTGSDPRLKHVDPEAAPLCFHSESRSSEKA